MYKPKKLIKADEYFPRVNEYIQPVLKEWMDEHRFGEDITLYHYTDARGVEGIISEREIWSTEIESMNDKKEIKYGMEVIEEEIESAKREYEDKLVKEVFLTSIEEEIRNLADEEYSIFVTCFCREGDLLSQWRGYADKGGGYSVEFNFNENTRISGINDEQERPYLRKVIYDKEAQKKMAGTLINSVCEICSTFPSLERDNPDKKEVWSSVAKYISKILIDFAIAFKHEGFEEEKEWRLVRVVRKENVNENTVDFRTNGGLIVPYVTTEVVEIISEEPDIFPVTGAIWGPSHNDDRARRSLNVFVESVYEKNPEIDEDNFNARSPEVPFEPPST